jgi:hypothetical protein
MIDDFWWEIHEQLKLEWEREPTYEEVQDYIGEMFKMTKEEEIEFNNRKVYGE